MLTFDELISHAKECKLKVAVMSGTAFNLTGTVARVSDDVLVLTVEDTTEVYIDRSKIFGMFLTAEKPAE